jgi:hypothetical protein
MTAMHTFTVRTLKIIPFVTGGTDPLPPDTDGFILQGDFLLNGNLRVPGEGKIHLVPDFAAAFDTPPPMIEIGFPDTDPGEVFPLLLADWAPGGFVINFETEGDLTTGPAFMRTLLSRYWITFLRAFP